MRFQRPMGAGRPGSEAPRPSFHASDGWEVHDGKMIMTSPNETHTSQSSRFFRLSGVKSAILRRHSDEESSFRRFVKSKKELFPEGVGSKDSSFSERGSVDLNDSVKNLVEEGHLYHMGVLSVLASQVEVIQAMVAHRGRSSRTARRCRSLSRRISRNRVSVSPGGVLDRAEVVGVPVTRRVTSKGRTEGEDAGVRDGGAPPQDGHSEPSAGTGVAAERCVAPPAGCEPGGVRGSPSAEGDAQRTAVPPLPLSELESEHGDGAGSYCSLMSPRTVSPTRKVEQWRARLAEVSPEPPPDGRPAAGEPTPCRPGPELRRLAGAVRGLQRQMSGFCRLVDELRTPVTPVTPVTPGSPGSSEASGARRRRRYLRERRGLQLPLLPDKPAPLAAEPARLQCSAPPPARRWDIRRPAPRRAASCERAVQTETEAAAPTASQPRPAAVSRSDGELTSATASAKQYRDALAPWDRAGLLAREVNLRSRCILEGVIRSTAC
ncbi:hypothetical protein FJT64_021104 [Amphibalanus amphitrite]|uniref:Uncharacterized protein n=1 Tax=Amphibalanus amphitrite TaxID=1232801 RepID=A0A6A4WZU9_AMPAM|nr:hypothetical protein FJT64_021104 [Amphibalanus amphitrite]